MLIQAPIPRTRLAVTPTNVRPIHVGLDSTPNRLSNHQSVLNMTQRIEERLPIRYDHKSLQIIKPQKENCTRIQGSSFYQSTPSKELQVQITELTKQRESMCYTLQEALRKQSLLNQQLEKLQNDKTQSAIQFQVNLDQFAEEIHTLTRRLEDLIMENGNLQEQYQSQQFYIEQLEYTENDQFNITHNFGQI